MIVNMMNYFTFGMIAILLLVFVILIIRWRSMVKKTVKNLLSILFNDPYEENLLELLPILSHLGWQLFLENNLRAATGDIANRPLGSSKKWPSFDQITYMPAQTQPFPISADDEVDVSVTIGPKAKKPMTINIPMMISGMAYGIALSDKARLSLAAAAANVGTAINSGEGGVLPEEIEIANHYILQFSKTKWSKEDELLKRANMIEVKLGQGALLGMGGVISKENLAGRAQQVMGLEDNEKAIIYEHFFENQTVSDLRDLVTELRNFTDGVPIGVKMGAGGRLEEDIDHLIEMGVDYIAIDGGQAATLGGPPILADDFGIPTLHAVVRANKHLQKRKMRDQISLVISGGLMVSSHFLKALALGADALYLGSTLLNAVSHNQSGYALPYEPPTQVIWNEGKFKNKFKQDIGAQAAENFLRASTEEMKTALRAMGKRSLQELSIQDLTSYDEVTAKMVGVPFTFHENFN